MLSRVSKKRATRAVSRRAIDPVRRELTEKLDRLCVGSTLRFEGGSIDGEADCLWSSSATERMTMHFSGSYDRDRIEFVSQASVPGGSVAQTRILERTGNCLTTAEAIDDAIARNDWSIAENKEATRWPRGRCLTLRPGPFAASELRAIRRSRHPRRTDRHGDRELPLRPLALENGGDAKRPFLFWQVSHGDIERSMVASTIMPSAA